MRLVGGLRSGGVQGSPQLPPAAKRVRAAFNEGVAKAVISSIDRVRVESGWQRCVNATSVAQGSSAELNRR